jgi:hypothetical protein
MQKAVERAIAEAGVGEEASWQSFRHSKERVLVELRTWRSG